MCKEAVELPLIRVEKPGGISCFVEKMDGTLHGLFFPQKFRYYGSIFWGHGIEHDQLSGIFDTHHFFAPWGLFFPRGFFEQSEGVVLVPPDNSALPAEVPVLAELVQILQEEDGHSVQTNGQLVVELPFHLQCDDCRRKPRKRQL